MFHDSTRRHPQAPGKSKRLRHGNGCTSSSQRLVKPSCFFRENSKSGWWFGKFLVYLYFNFYTYIYIHWLVVWNIVYFPFYIWDNPNPIDELIFFQDG